MLSGFSFQFGEQAQKDTQDHYLMGDIKMYATLFQTWYCFIVQLQVFERYWPNILFETM